MNQSKSFPSTSSASAKPPESVWDYPRPPRMQPCELKVRVEFGGEIIASSERSIKVLETSHPPVYYIPEEDVNMEFIEIGSGRSHCEWKGEARYLDIRVGKRIAQQAAWQYLKPERAFSPIAGHIAFYASRVDACFVDDVEVIPQPGNFYGGCITPELQGPYKVGAGIYQDVSFTAREE